ncbi:MAG: hypothetical protein ACRD43_01900 [Pyrinomonadaceae bacterium]
MNRLSFLRSILFFSVVASTVPVFGQTAEMSSAQISAKIRAAKAFLQQLPYRSISKPETLDPATSQAKSNSVLVTEVVPPNSSRFLQTTDQPGAFSRLEGIVVNGRSFRKVDDRPWEELTNRRLAMSPPPPPIAAVAGTSKPTVTFEYKLLERTNLDGRDVSVFETVATVVMDGKQTEVQTTRNWISLDGLLRKVTFAKNVQGEKPLFRTTVTYEYDNIKIEVPIK